MSHKRKPLPKALRVRVYKKYAGRCAYCGKQIKYEDMQVDHIKAVYLAVTMILKTYCPPAIHAISIRAVTA